MAPTVTVRFTGELCRLAGRDSLQLPLEEGVTLKDVVLRVGRTVSPAFADQVVGPLLRGEPAVPLLLHNRTLSLGSDLDRPVGEGDIVAFALPMEGG